MRLALLAEAAAELEDAAAWYDDRSEGLGEEFLSVAREAAHLIAESAETWPMWPGAPARIPPIRRFLLPRFPYALAYQAFPVFSPSWPSCMSGGDRCIGSAGHGDDSQRDLRRRFGVCANHLGARTVVRQFPESCRRNATPNDRTRVLARRSGVPHLR